MWCLGMLPYSIPLATRYAVYTLVAVGIASAIMMMVSHPLARPQVGLTLFRESDPGALLPSWLDIYTKDL